MSLSAARQKELSQQLASLAGITQRQATNVLKKYDFKIDRAADAIYNGSVVLDSKSSAKQASLEKIFNKYKGIEGTIRFIQDLGLELEDRVVLAIAYHLQAPAVGRFLKNEFITGWTALNVDTLTGMKGAVAEMDRKMREDDSYFANVYRYTFVFNLQEGQRILTLDTAVDYWKLLLHDKFPLLPTWIEFVTTNYKRSISKDTWNMLWEFVVCMREDSRLENYDTEGEWPSVLDEFVEYLKAAKAE